MLKILNNEYPIYFLFVRRDYSISFLIINGITFIYLAVKAASLESMELRSTKQKNVIY